MDNFHIIRRIAMATVGKRISIGVATALLLTTASGALFAQPLTARDMRRFRTLRAGDDIPQYRDQVRGQTEGDRDRERDGGDDLGGGKGGDHPPEGGGR